MQKRPRDPDSLLREIQESRADRTRGRLKVFLGASAGVGKTYAMLSEAHQQMERGVNVIVGYVETHGRVETQALTKGLNILPRRKLEYRGIELEEFDLDGALARKPQLILVDELAHTNVPGSRHPRRWLDVQELLEAGIDVYTAINVQHLESLKDAVAQITGVFVQETVPDVVVERADDIEVVDIPPEELRQRLREGKVYFPERIDHALEGFFCPANLHALREIALRRAADRVDEQMRALRAGQGEQPVWPARERILVCIAPSALASKVVRAAARLGAASHAEVLALYVESDRQETGPALLKEHAMKALRLSESLGISTTTLAGHDIAGEILQFARKQNATLIVVGKPIRPRWREILFGSVVDELVRRSEEIDVHVVSEIIREERSKVLKQKPRVTTTPVRMTATLGIVAACALVGTVLDHFGTGDANLVMVLLVGVAVVASRFGALEAVVATVLSILSFNFLFVEPRFTFAVSDSQYLLTFAIMLGDALLISSLTLKLRMSATASSERERRTSALYTLSRELAKGRTKVDLATAAKREIESVFSAEVAVFGRQEANITALVISESGFEERANERAVADWTFGHGQPAGKDTDTLGGADALYLPLMGGQGTTGVLAFQPREDGWPLTPAQRSLLETFANTLGLALERVQLAKDSHEARISAESERLRNALLSSISHDLRTPLTSISGAASALVAQGAGELATTIYQESARMNLQVQNLLDMTRLQSGEVKPRFEWQVLEEIVGSSLARSKELLHGHEVFVSIPSNLPLLQIDAELMEKLFINLFENASIHTPPGTRIDVSAVDQSDIVRIIVSDNGPGIPPGEEVAVFERFSQGGAKGRGLGLGLAICRAIARVHNGRIWVRNGRNGGAEFHIELPRPKEQPEVPIG